MVVNCQNLIDDIHAIRHRFLSIFWHRLHGFAVYVQQDNSTQVLLRFCMAGTLSSSPGWRLRLSVLEVPLNMSMLSNYRALSESLNSRKQKVLSRYSHLVCNRKHKFFLWLDRDADAHVYNRTFLSGIDFNFSKL